MADEAGIPLGGKGGYIAVHDLSDDTYFLLDNSEYSFESDTMRDELTAGLSGGWSKKVHRSNCVTGLVVMLPEDNPSSIEASAFKQNNAYNLFCKRGNISDATKRFDLFTGTVFCNLKKSNSARDGTPRQAVLTFEGGDYSPSQAGTSALIAYLVSISREAS